MNSKKYVAGAMGTFFLTFAGCGSAVIISEYPLVGIGLLGVPLAFGLGIVTLAYAMREQKCGDTGAEVRPDFGGAKSRDTSGKS
jgi:glycerol uptake facilitator-like aquaporin